MMEERQGRSVTILRGQIANALIEINENQIQ
jgi:hypothetical protein